MAMSLNSFMFYITLHVFVLEQEIFKLVGNVLDLLGQTSIVLQKVMQKTSGMRI